MSSVQGPAEGGASSCPECGRTFHRTRPLQLFCTPLHRDRWNNRQAIRGRVLTPLQMVARITRNGTRGSASDRATGRLASTQVNYLVNRWRDEDRDAQHMPWPAYLTLRYAIGFDPL